MHLSNFKKVHFCAIFCVILFCLKITMALNLDDSLKIKETAFDSSIIGCIPVFSDNLENKLESFLSIVESLRNNFRWNDCEVRLIFQLKLAEKVKSKLSKNILSKGNFNEIADELRKIFSVKTPLVTKFYRLSNVFQLPNETVREFFTRVEALAYACLEDSNSEEQIKLINNLKLSVACNGLKPLISSRLTVGALESFDELKRQALVLEESQLGIKPAIENIENVNVKSENDIKILINKLIESNEAAIKSNESRFLKLENQVKFLTSQLQRKSENKTIVCYRCNKAGHIARFCRNTVVKKQFFSRNGNLNSKGGMQ